MFEEDARQAARNRRSVAPRVRARCPECASWVPLKDSVELWDLVTCPHCDTRLEVVDLKPLTLDYAEDTWEEEEDWEEEDLDDEEYY
ncbi:MAG: hypothetical protein Kow00120_01520 [Anaerolineae bacterium]